MFLFSEPERVKRAREYITYILSEISFGALTIVVLSEKGPVGLSFVNN